MRIDSVALDKAGIARRSLATGLAEIDQRDAPAAPLKVRSYAYTDNPGTKNDDVDLQRLSVAPTNAVTATSTSIPARMRPACTQARAGA